MAPTPEPHEIEFLPLVKAYPALSRRYGEVSCIAGLDMKTSEWIRLYPVPFRTLEDASSFGSTSRSAPGSKGRAMIADPSHGGSMRNRLRSSVRC